MTQRTQTLEIGLGQFHFWKLEEGKGFHFDFVMFEQGIRQFGWTIVRNQTNPNNYDEKISKTARIERSFAWRHRPDSGHGVCLEQWRKWHRDTERPVACPG